MSTKAYQEWDYVLNLAGTNMQSMSAGMKTLTNKFDDAIGGSKTAQETFQRLGLSMEDISSMSREDLFKATITAFQGMEESAERAALANDLFGRSGQELVPLFNQTAEATQEQIDRANEYGMIMGEDLVKDSAAFVDAQTTLKGTITGLKNSLMGEFLPSLTSVTEGMAAFLAGDSGGLGMMQSGIQEFVNSLMANLPKVMEFGAGILQALGEGIIQNLPALIESAVQIIMQLTQTLLDNLPMLITALVQGLTEALPVLLGELPNIIQTVVLTLMDNLPALIECVTSLVVAIAEALPDIIMAIIEILPDLIVIVVMTLIDQIPVLIECAIQVTAAIVKALPQIFMAIINALVKLVVELAGKLREKWVEFKMAAGEWISKIWSGIQEKWGT
ncbi:phage tail protein, partial [Ralstonia pseudosolanacearum]|uniref:phage tail protein n=1 Tax=Ralstonia pseudosolanacearum TaxID=1310165 RepID=UPI003CEA1915